MDIIEKILIKENIDYSSLTFISWYNISVHLKLPESFIKKYMKNFDGLCILKYQQNLSEDLIEFILKNTGDDVKWHTVFKYQTLSEDFIERLKFTYLNWYDISMYQKLSENFIKKHVNDVSWYNISRYQILSTSFIEEFENYIYFSGISNNPGISEETLEHFQDKILWENVSRKFSFKFLINVYLPGFLNRLKTLCMC